MAAVMHGQPCAAFRWPIPIFFGPDPSPMEARRGSWSLGESGIEPCNHGQVSPP